MALKNNDVKVRMKVTAAAAGKAATDAAGAVGRAASEVGRFAGDKVELVRVNAQMNEAQKALKNLFSELGEAFYASDCPAKEQFGDWMQKIEAKQEEIDQLKDSAAALRGKQICPNCQRECSAEDGFCAKCGAALREETQE